MIMGSAWNLMNISMYMCSACTLIVLVINGSSTLVGHFMSSPRKREKRDRRDSREDEREG